MNIYAQIGPDNRVHTIMESSNKMVPLDQNDQRLLNTMYDPVTGEFTGYRITLTANKSYIMADGVDTVRVTATIKTWDDQDSSETFVDPILFVVDGIPKLITKKSAGYYIDYKTTAPGTKEITTQDDKFMGQGAASILVVEVEEEDTEE